jgi:hypothetical protein
MKSCQQNEHQTIYDHGFSVLYHFEQLYSWIIDDYEPHKDILKGFKLPNWFTQYKERFIEKLAPTWIWYDYTLYHDCGKPRCLTIDENGKRHFPNHAKISADLYRAANGDEEAAKLIEMDMDIHLLKTEGIEEFASRPEAITLLIAGLAEIHSNAIMFGGIESTSFKIKWKHLDKKGQKICDIIFKDKGNTNDGRVK